MIPVSFPRQLAVALFAAVCLVGARAEDSTSKIKFSDPGKPGTLKIAMARGDIVIDGADTPEIVVKSDMQAKRKTNKEGLRVLTEAATFSLTEKDNIVTLDAVSDGWVGSPSNLRITVPRGTNVVVGSSLGGDITCTGIGGDIEIKSLQGDTKLNDVTGGVLVETMHGDVSATLRELRDGKAYSFTSMNGRVQLRLPANAKANVRLRTQNGTIATDFDEKSLVTKVEAVAGSGSHRHSSGALSDEAREAFRQAARASAEAMKHAAEAVREAAEAARQGAEEGDSNQTGVRTTSIKPPRPPMPPSVPTMTGGKLVTGTLNGGGPEINVATMNGDVTLRRLDSK